MRLLGERLNGQQIEQFRKALSDAFRKRSFEEMLRTQLDRRLEDITEGPGFKRVIWDTIEEAEEEEWTAELLQAARWWRPQNALLFAFAQQFGLAPAIRQEALQRKVRPNKGDLDSATWRACMAEREAQVCCIEIRGGGTDEYGTGFLLGPDVVMTGYHVMERVIKGEVSPKEVNLLFDYKLLEDGKTVHGGTISHLAEQDWLLDSSSYSSLDFSDNTVNADPNVDELDYALLRLSEKPGNDQVGGESNKNPRAPLRKWIEIPAEMPQLVSSSELFIFHHPDGNRLRLALDTESIIGVNSNKTRVRYQTNTDYGSSGAPCFNANWELVAMHHSGDPNYEAHHKPEYNQGIPFAAILHLLEKRGKRHLLGEEPVNAGQKPIELNKYREQRDAKELFTHESFLEQIRQHLDDAQRYVQTACAPFTEGLYPSSEQFEDAIESLEAADASIQSFETLLSEATSLPETLAKKRVNIKDEVATIREQINDSLIPLLTWNTKGNFSTLQASLHNINGFIFG